VGSKEIADEHVKKSRMTIKGKSASLLTPHQFKGTIRAELTVDPGKSPKHIDWVRKAGPGKGKTMRGIYEFLNEDRYRVCFAAPGKKRPTKFATNPRSGHTLHVWKRVKK
jgi:uncharacterized protein (TIGR03067 family)